MEEFDANFTKPEGWLSSESTFNIDLAKFCFVLIFIRFQFSFSNKLIDKIYLSKCGTKIEVVTFRNFALTKSKTNSLNLSQISGLYKPKQNFLIRKPLFLRLKYFPDPK